MNNIILSIPMRSTLDRLIHAVTTKAGLAGWLTPDVQAEPKVGSSVKLNFGPGFALGFRVERIDPAGCIEWISTDGPEEWKGSRILFEANADSGTLHFTFTHAGLPAEYPMQAFLTYCWANHVRSLKLLLETGKGEPYGSTASRAWHPLE
jgi:uncharacterized protein YndB with AHSA1/START domain